MTSKLPLSLAVVVAGATTACSSGYETATRESVAAVSVAACAAAASWAPWTAYARGALVTYAGSTYECIQAHTSEPGWTPDAVPALWEPTTCAPVGNGASSSGGAGSGSGATSSSSSSGSSGGAGNSACDPSAWVYMGSDANACAGHLGESCGWTATNEGQGYHCQPVSWGAGCEPGGESCSGAPGTSGSGTSSSSSSSSSSGGGATSSSSSGGTGGTQLPPPAGSFVLSPYKDYGTSLNWNTNVASTAVSGSLTPLASDVAQAGGNAITLAFATGECGSENWAGVPGKPPPRPTCRSSRKRG